MLKNISWDMASRKNIQSQVGADVIKYLQSSSRLAVPPKHAKSRLGC